MPKKQMKKVKKHTFRFSGAAPDVDRSVSKRIIVFASVIGGVFLVLLCRLSRPSRQLQAPVEPSLTSLGVSLCF